MPESQFLDEFVEICQELQEFYTKLCKEPSEKRIDIHSNKRKSTKLFKYKFVFHDLTERFNKKHSTPETVGQVTIYANEINQYIVKIQKILDDRLKEIDHESKCLDDIKDLPLKVELVSSLDNYLEGNSLDSIDNCNNHNSMAEKFDLKTATSLLPIMNGTDKVTQELIDAIDLYDALLDGPGKVLLTSFVLKRCVSASAKLRLKSNYINNQLLLADIRKNFLPAKSIAVLSNKLNSARQGDKSIDDFGKSIEELLVNLTISQAADNKEHIPILQEINEKLAINAFASGLHNSEIRTIIKARNCGTLAEAISAAKDEEIPHRRPQLLHIRGGRQNFRRGHHYRGKSHRGRNTHFQNTNFQNTRNNRNSNGNGSTNNYNNNYRNNNGRFNRRGHTSNRGYTQNREQRSYVATTNNSQSNDDGNEIQEGRKNLFFRVSNQ